MSLLLLLLLLLSRGRVWLDFHLQEVHREHLSGMDFSIYLEYQYKPLIFIQIQSIFLIQAVVAGDDEEAQPSIILSLYQSSKTKTFSFSNFPQRALFTHANLFPVTVYLFCCGFYYDWKLTIFTSNNYKSQISQLLLNERQL